MLRQRIVVFALSTAIILLLAASSYLLFVKEKNDSKPGADSFITGTFDINGTIPPDTKAVFFMRSFRSEVEFVKTMETERVRDESTWKIRGLKSSSSYEIKARLISNNQIIAESNTIFVTAPANNEQVVFNIGNANGDSGTITGVIITNGYIPAGGVILLESKEEGKDNYEDTNIKLGAKITQSFIFSKIISGKTYDLKGRLYDSTGTSIGTSLPIRATAPAKNELIIINSYAAPPRNTALVQKSSNTSSTTITPTPNVNTQGATATISGVIDFNGQAPTNSRIVIFQKLKGASNFQISVNNLSPLDNTAWSWNSASNGALYEMFAVLKQKQTDGTDKDIASSITKTIAAPAKDQSFTINSGISLPPPSGGVTVKCVSDSGATRSVLLKLDTVNGAATYWYQVGTTSGGTELANQTSSAQSGDQQILNLTFKENVTYYARYSYSGAPDVAAGSSQFSPFSGISSHHCP